jgi:hypothetical protein
MSRLNVIPPVQSEAKKYSALSFSQISGISAAVPPHQKGRFAIVTNVGRGMRWTRGVPLTRARFADGEAVSS